MRRRQVIAGLAVAAVALPARSHAQQSKRYRIGMIETTPQRMNAGNAEAFRKGMAQLGYVEGTGYEILYVSADGDPGRFPQLAADLVRLPVDLIITLGTPATVAAKSATATIPIVIAAAGDPVGTGLVASLSRPGGNVTGLSGYSTELAAKFLELVKETVPGIVRVGMLVNMSNPVNRLEWSETTRAARLLGLEAVQFDVRKSDEIRTAFEVAAAQKIGAMSVTIDTVLQADRQSIVDLATRHRLPTFYAEREFVEAGGLISFRVDIPGLYFRAAAFVDRIIKGAKPADMPIEQPTALKLIVNLKAAKALGLAIPMSVMTRADEVIE